MLLLIDIGNTHTHLGLANRGKVTKHSNVLTSEWVTGRTQQTVANFIGSRQIDGACFCTVVPGANAPCVEFLRAHGVPYLQLHCHTVAGVGIDYPKPETIGADRLANAVAAKHHFGAPSVVVDFGTAVTFDVVDRKGNYVGGIIAPGLSAMTEYLHEKTALLPKIKIREINAVIGKNTEEAMLIGAVHGYRGLIHGLLLELKAEMRCARLPVVATGGYAKLLAAKLPDISAVEPLLTLEGLRLVWEASREPQKCPKSLDSAVGG